MSLTLITDEESGDGCLHSGVGGIVVVHDEDLDTVARMRRGAGLAPIECLHCDYIYTVDKEWHLPW